MDGSCLYHAVYELLRYYKPAEVTNMKVEDLRQKLIKFFESNPTMPGDSETHLQDFLCLPLDNDRGRIQPEDMYIEEKISEVDNQKALRWQRFLKRIQEGEWGGDLEILGIAQYFQIEICVLCLNNRNDGLMRHQFNESNNGARTRCHIGHVRVHNRGFHFVALLPIEDQIDTGMFVSIFLSVYKLQLYAVLLKSVEAWKNGF